MFSFYYNLGLAKNLLLNVNTNNFQSKTVIYTNIQNIQKKGKLIFIETDSNWRTVYLTKFIIIYSGWK